MGTGAEAPQGEKLMSAKLRLIVPAAALLAATAAPAALPPNHQRLAELRAVLAHPGVVGAFGLEEPIDRVEYLSRDLYRVTSGRCRIDVAIVGLPNGGRRGPRRFEARPGAKVCAGARR